LLSFPHVTGLFSVFDDFEALSASTLLCGTLNLCLPARNAVDLHGGRASCRMGDRQANVAKAFRGWGCTDRDAAFTVNMALCTACPCIVIYWRAQMRAIFSIDGKARA